MLAGPVMQQCRFSKSNDLTGLKKKKSVLANFCLSTWSHIISDYV